MNKIVNEFLLAGDECIPQLLLRSPGFSYTACEPFNNIVK